MNTPPLQPIQVQSVRCVVCETSSRPLYVPWEQHALGCAVRAAQLEQPTVPAPQAA